MAFELETVDESEARVRRSQTRRVEDTWQKEYSRLLWEMDQLPESRTSRASD
jgi:hypothetical protein